MNQVQKKRLAYELTDGLSGVFSLLVVLWVMGFVQEQMLTQGWHILLGVLAWINAACVYFRILRPLLRRGEKRFPSRPDCFLLGVVTLNTLLLAGIITHVVPPGGLYAVMCVAMLLSIVQSIFSVARMLRLALDIRSGGVQRLTKTDHWSPVIIFFLGMSAWVLVSTLLLMTPNAHTSGSTISFIDALFTCASATSITGLTCIDVGAELSRFGQFIVLLDFQIGAMGVMTFTYFVMMMIGNRLSVENSSAVSSMLDQENLRTIPALLRTVVGVTLCIEAVGALLLYNMWEGVQGVDQAHLLFYAIFHSVSAFCNVGITLFPDNMAQSGVSSCYSAQVVMLLLIIAGTLGFGIYREALARLGRRLHHKKNTRRWSTHSWLVMRVTAIVLLGGFLGLTFLSFLEPSSTHAITGHSLWESLWNTVGRSAGFNLTDIAEYGPVYKLFLCILMFVGGNPAGTGGGVFAPVVAICVLEVFRVLRGQQDVQIHERRIARSTVERAMATVVLSIFWIIVTTMLLLLVEEWSSGADKSHAGLTHLLNMLFLEVSAYTTTGYSLIDPADLSWFSKFIITLNMLFGRMGMFTFMLIFITPKPPQAFRYPETRLPLN